MAFDKIVNAKTQRPGVCNAVETLLIDRRIAGKLLPLIAENCRNMGWNSEVMRKAGRY